MKKIFAPIAFAFIGSAMLLATGCKKDATTTTPQPAAGKAVFTAKINGDAYSAPDSSYVLNGAGGTIAVFSKDTKNRGFQMAIFEKDFPVGKAVAIQFSPSVAYRDASNETYIFKAGTMTITEYGKTSAGSVNHLTGNFSGTVTGKGGDFEITEGKFDVRTK